MGAFGEDFDSFHGDKAICGDDGGGNLLGMLSSLVLLGLSVAAPVSEARNVVFLFTDGLRWQEVFRGADEELMKGAKPTDAHYKKYWRPTVEARRKALMPFVWSTIGTQGQLYGNRDRGSTSRVLNGLKFSYPGYSETLQGFVDPGIRSNDAVPNPNVTVFEWLNKQSALRGKVAAFGNWAVVSAIFNKQRCGLYVQSGMEPITFSTSPAAQLFNRLQAKTDHPFPSDPADAFTYEASMMYLREKQPTLLGVLFGETDSYAHSGKYPAYLTAANRFDHWVSDYWTVLQAMPKYRGKTTLIITTDHGRGDGGKWTSHGETVKNAEYTWMMVLGPDTPALGEMMNTGDVTNGQVASSIAKLLGFDYVKQQPKAAPALPRLLN